MTDSVPHVVNIKNQWLFDQVEVEFPTPESLRGRSVYQRLCENNTISPFVVSEQESKISLDDIYLVDFHRLTIMFSLLEATRAENEQEQNDLVEFFTQIIFSEPCYLYVGFYQSEPVAAAIVTEFEGSLLVSDIAMKAVESFGSTHEFASSVVNKWRSSHEFEGSIFIEQ